MTNYKLPDKKRIEAVFKHELPDRVPNFEILVDNPTLNYILGRNICGWDVFDRKSEVAHTLDNISPEDYMEFSGKVGQDVIGMCFYDRPFMYEDEDGNIKRRDFRIKTRNDLKRLLLLNLNHLDNRFKMLDKYQEAIQGTNIGLFALLADFFCDAYNDIFGFEEFMYLIYDDLWLIEEILERYTDHYIKMAERLVKYDLSFLYIGDDVAFKSGTLINPDMLRKIWLPRLARIIDVAKRKNLPVLFHSCGNITEMLPDLIDAGVDAINPIEPNAMDIRAIKKKFGKNLAFVGNIDVGGALSRGIPEQVRRESRQLIEDVGRDGGLVLASSHSITKNVPPENYLAMVEAAHSYIY